MRLNINAEQLSLPYVVVTASWRELDADTICSKDLVHHFDNFKWEA
jgi:hypothetical protein